MEEPKAWSHHELTRARIAEYIEDNKLTHAQMAERLKLTSPTRLTKYLNLYKPDNRAEADSPQVESACKHFLRYEDRTAILARSLFENSVSTSVCSVLRHTRRTGDISLLHGPAGIGKSCGAICFRKENADTAIITATYWRQGPSDMEALLFDGIQDDPAVIARPWPHNIKKLVWMEEIFRGTERMIIIDNAQRLHLSAFKLLFDFHDVTGCSIGLIGNPEVMDIVRPNDQLFSRIGMVRSVNLGDDAPEIAKKMIAQYAPDSGKDLHDLAADVLAKPGHGRTLRKQLNLTAVIHEESPKLGWDVCFKAAGTQLIKPGAASGARRRR